MQDTGEVAPVELPHSHGVEVRLAIVETKQNVTNEDLKLIRTSLHQTNNTLQQTLILEQRCVDDLKTIKGQTERLPDMLAAVTKFHEMQPNIEALIAARYQREGGRASWAAIGAITVATMSLVTNIALVFVAWFHGH